VHRNYKSSRDPCADRANERAYREDKWQLDQYGSENTGGYLKGWLPSMVTLAEASVDEFEVTWTSKTVERLMREVSKQCSNQWMRWIAKGLQALLHHRLVKYANPSHY